MQRYLTSQHSIISDNWHSEQSSLAILHIINAMLYYITIFKVY